MILAILPSQLNANLFNNAKSLGFTLFELVAIIVVIGIIGGAAANSLVPSTSFQIQASRDTVVAALFHAQQRALSQTDNVRVITSAQSIDIRQDFDNNASFDADESIHVGGMQYPLTFAGGVTISSHTLNYDRLGETTSTTLTLTKSSSVQNVTLSATGFAY